MRPPVTGIETDHPYGPSPTLVRHDPKTLSHPGGITVPYACPNDVPTPLRHTVRACHQNGFTVKDLALIYDLPEQWVTLFVMPDARLELD